MCAGECTWAPVWLSPAVVVVAALSQHAVGAVRERGEEASWWRRLQARGAVGAWCVGRRTGLWKRHHTGAAWADSYGPSDASWLSIPQLLFSYQPGHRHIVDGLLIYLGTGEHWSECSVGRLWFWAGASPDPPTSLTCLNQTHTFHKSVQCLWSCKSPSPRPWSRMLKVAYHFVPQTKTHLDGMVDEIFPNWR